MRAALLSLFFLPIGNRVVIETLKETDGARKCFRMVGGVLVERTVAEVLPAVEANYSGVSDYYTEGGRSTMDERRPLTSR